MFYEEDETAEAVGLQVFSVFSGFVSSQTIASQLDILVPEIRLFNQGLEKVCPFTHPQATGKEGKVENSRDKESRSQIHASSHCQRSEVTALRCSGGWGGWGGWVQCSVGTWSRTLMHIHTLMRS